MQQSIAPSEAGVINGAQESLINVFYICSFLMTIIFSDPSIFAAPAWISFIAVVIASVCYTQYASKQLDTTNPFPALETFKLHKKMEYIPPTDLEQASSSSSGQHQDTIPEEQPLEEGEIPPQAEVQYAEQEDGQQDTNAEYYQQQSRSPVQRQASQYDEEEVY